MPFVPFRISLAMKFRPVLLLSLFLLVSLLACSSAGANQPTVTLNDPVVARRADLRNRPIEPTTEFKTTDKKVCIAISATAPAGTTIGYRWYRENELLLDDRIVLDARGTAAILLQPPNGSAFAEGNYRVELYLVKTAEKVATFKVTR